MTLADVILNLLYNADAAAREYPEAVNEDLVIDLPLLVVLVNENGEEVKKIYGDG